MLLKNIFKKETRKTEIDKESLKIPVHIGFIMDGNGRWAKKRSMPRTVGHRAGVETLRKVIRYCGNIGVKYVTFYAFSTENWRRPKDEVDTLMHLFVEYFNSEIDELIKENARILILGSREGVPEDVMETILMAEERTRNNDGITVNIAFNYGSRDEIINAARTLAEKCVNGEMKPEDISEDVFASCLYTKDQPDPDLIVRTSREMRLSNFMLYQAAYSEFEFPEVLWPDVTEETLDEMLMEYSLRDRRFGKV